MQHVGASTLFGVPVPLAEWDYWIGHGGVRQRRVPVGAELSTRGWLTSFGMNGHLLPIAVVRGEERLPFHSGQALRAGDEILLLERVEVAPEESDRFDQLVAAATIVDVPGEITLDRFFARTADELAPVLDRAPNDLFRLLWDREHAGSTVLTPGLAIPHVLLPGEGRFEMMIARCREGVRFPSQDAPVTAVFVLASTADQRTLHLRALSAITQIVHDPGFEDRWSKANGPVELREVVRRAKRRRF